MEESFRVRVDRTFASLSSSSSSSSQSLSSSLWSLTDDEIPKKSWVRDSQVDAAQPDDPDDDDDDDEGCPFPSGVDRLLSKFNIPNPNPNPDSSVQDFYQELEDDLKELNDDDEIDDDEDGDEDKDVGTGEEGDDEFDVRNSIGKDCTVDFEEEEDEYDKVAVGREKTGDRLYMSDVTDYMPDFYSRGEIPVTFKEAFRDPRANHLAASVRLKEDAEAARSFNSLQVSEEIKTVSETPNNMSENGNNLKPILKRKEDQIGSKSEKRVRFEPSCKTGDETEGDKNVFPGASSEEITLHKDSSSQHRDSSMVPDYVRNPSRYTHYTFDSSNDMNEESNRRAYMDFFNMLKKSKHSDPEEAPADLSKPVIFNPKKKPAQDLMSGNSNEIDLTKEIPMEEPMHNKNLPLSFASGSMPEDEASEMEVDEQVTVATKTLKGGGEPRTGRQYRARQSLESEE